MRVRPVAGYAAFGGALVYVLLKLMWIAGSTFGVSDLNGTPRGEWVFDNVVTGLLGVVGMVAALATVRPWGMRVPVWLIAVPMWVGAGLLAPFVPLILAAAVLTAAGWWTPPDPAPDSAQPVLEPWTFGIVYGSFIVLGVGLVIAYPLYARARFRGTVEGTVGQVPAGPTHPAQVPLAWTAAVVAVGLAVFRLSWAFGSPAGLVDGSRDGWLRLTDLVTAVQFTGAAVGLLVLVHRWGAHRPVTLPLTAVWLGAGGMVGAGLLGMPTILTGDRWAPAGQTFASHATATFLTFAAGSLISVVALVLLTERAAVLSHEETSDRRSTFPAAASS